MRIIQNKSIKEMVFKKFLIAITILYSASGYAGAQGVKSGRTSHPNVIIIYADDLGYGDLSCYGATQIHTPNIDQLASEGLRFTNGHAVASTCTPSRFSILTGEYAFRNQEAHILPGNASLLISLHQATIGTVFQRAGYRTACIGKWHVGLGPEEGPDWNGEIRPGPNEVGFDYSFIFPATADRVPTVYVENHHIIALDSSDPIEVSYQHKVGNDPTGKEHPELLKMKSSHGHDGTIVNGIGRIGWMQGGHKARWTDESLADDFLSQAQMFIEKNQQHPFFLYYAVNEIHVPRMPDTRFKGKSKLGYRGDVILEMDHVVGELLKTLDYLGLTQNTLIIFSSDNGPVLDDGYVDDAVSKAHGHKPAGPFRGGKYSMFEGGTRIPFIVRWPGMVKPGVSDALVSQVDLLASFAALTHQKLMPGDAPDSRNMLDALLGKTTQGRDTYVEQNNGSVLAFIKDGWKYIEPHKGPALLKGVNIESGLSTLPQLYNLKTDKEEKSNVAKEHPDRVKQMAEELKQVREKKP
jgi:arylsulfatase A-like enzyme